MIDVLAVLFFLLIIWNIKPVDPLRDIFSDYLSVSNGKAWRGIFTVLVLFHHLSQRTESGQIFRVFEQAGIIGVSLFFFYSGYGLMKRHTTTTAYHRGFIKKRLPSIYVPYWTATIIVLLINALFGYYFTPEVVLLALIGIKPVVMHAWFITVLLMFYCIFWLLMLLFRNHYWLMVTGATMWWGGWIWLCTELDYGLWWYNTAHMLIIGMIWALVGDKVVSSLPINVLWVFPVAGYLITAIRIRENGDLLVPISYGSLTWAQLTTVFFILSWLFFMMKLRVGNQIARYLGGIAIEVYLAQGIFQTWLRSDYLYIDSDFYYAVACTLGAIGVGALLNIVNTHILVAYRKKFHVS
ncbi:MAG: acyltransferase [Actinomycetaceae bacterium]|nr:acyltransferase [Actinomycetaceae bacterium]